MVKMIGWSIGTLFAVVSSIVLWFCGIQIMGIGAIFWGMFWASVGIIGEELYDIRSYWVINND